MHKIKNIVFDLGNVLVDLDFGKTYQAFEQVLEPNTSFDRYKKETEELFEKFELGGISSGVFLAELRKKAAKSTTLTEIENAWNAMLLGIAAPRFELLRRLKKDYRLFVLSNTNEIHMDWIFRHIETDHGILDFKNQYFEKIYLSHLIQMRKPDLAIFEFIMQDAGIQAGETLFVDDKVENIEAALTAGWLAMLHNPEKEIVEVMKSYLTS